MNPTHSTALDEKISEILDSVWDEAVDMMEDGGTADISRPKATIAIKNLVLEECASSRKANRSPEPALHTTPTASEDICQICSGDNPVWFAPNELWNKVIGEKLHFVCPNCFIREAGTIKVWRLTNED